MIPNKKIILLVLISTILIIAGFLGGWLLKPASTSSYATPLRLRGYKFIGPLLVCNTSDKNSPTMEILSKKLDILIDQEIKKNNITSASVYFQDLNTNRRAVINKDEKYYLASLGKIPVMIAYYEAAQANPGILSQQFNLVIPSNTDKNTQQEIKPSNSAQSGGTYTAEQLIEKMIDYSDNNATYALVNNIGLDAIHKIYSDFQLPYLDNPTTSDLDFMTVNDFSFFFRSLYNNSYLGDTYSEKALNVLSQTDFNNGIVAGLPKNILVSHKFGLTTITNQQGIITKRELNDCGIVYQKNNPYLICVMTKSTAGLPNIESTIQKISALAWDEVNNNYK